MSELALGCASLSRLGVIRASGVDARSFLQGQLTADLRRLSPTYSPLAAWCTPQGRVLFLMQLIERPGGFLLVLPRSELERAQKRLKMFVLRAKVTLEDLGNDWGVLGVAVHSSPAPLAEVMAAPPWSAASAEELSACRLPGAPPRCWLLGPVAALANWRAASQLPAISEDQWWADDTALGLPWVEGAASERFLPQQLNLDRLGVMSFDKGCYPGQEIIARLKFRGQVKSRLRSGESAQAPSPGAKLYRAEATTGQSVGEVVSVATLAGHSLFTAVVDLDAAGELHLGAPDGPVVTLDADHGD